MAKPDEDKDFLRRHFDDLAKKCDPRPDFKNGKLPTSGDTQCGKFVTFKEYVSVIG